MNLDAPYVAPRESAVPAGALVLVGGNEDKFFDLKILRRIVALAGSGEVRVEVITTASSMPEELGAQYLQAFERIGVHSVQLMHIHQRNEAQDPDMVERIHGARIVFFTGGDQLRITSVLGGTPVSDAIFHKYHKVGGVVAGTSAGASAMSETMIYEGESSEALRKGVVQMTGGLGLIRHVVVDTHFVKRGRFSRLMSVGAANPMLLGLGLGEDTGVVVHNGHILEAIGDGLVVICDGRHVNYSNIGAIEIGGSIAVQNMLMHTLTEGHGFCLERREYLVPARLKEELAPAVR